VRVKAGSLSARARGILERFELSATTLKPAKFLRPAMRAALSLVGLLLVTAALAGCTGGGTGTVVVQGSDPVDDIADFSSLVVQLSGAHVRSSDGSEKDVKLNITSVDVVKLQGGNLSTLAQQDVPAGNYSGVRLDVTSASGSLRAGGTASVDVPSDSLKMNGDFTVQAGQTVNLRVDLHVVKTGSGKYVLRPVIGKVG